VSGSSRSSDTTRQTVETKAIGKGALFQSRPGTTGAFSPAMYMSTYALGGSGGVCEMRIVALPNEVELRIASAQRQQPGRSFASANCGSPVGRRSIASDAWKASQAHWFAERAGVNQAAEVKMSKRRAGLDDWSFLPPCHCRRQIRMVPLTQAVRSVLTRDSVTRPPCGFDYTVYMLLEAVEAAMSAGPGAPRRSENCQNALR
jgi:hypothetical protein